MPYLGASPKETFTAGQSQTITGTGATAYSLNTAVTTPEDLEVFINNVRQQPTTAYTVSGSTITFDEALLSSDTCYVVFQGQRKESRTHPAASNLQAANVTASGNATVTGDLTVDTNTLFVDASINTVGILNTAPGNYLDGEFTVGNSTKDQYINVVTGAANAAGICFQDTTGTSIVSGLRYTHGDDALGIWAAGAQRLRVDADGLKFGTDSAAANALDDYEEGTFLPKYGGTTGNGTVTYNNMNGVYTKIGRTIRLWIDISIASASGMSGTPIIYNLPYASANDLGTEAASGNAPINATVRYDMGQSVWWDIHTNYTGSRPATGWMTNGVSYFLLYTHNANYNSGHAQMQLNQTGRIAFSLVYTTNS